MTRDGVAERHRTEQAAWQAWAQEKAHFENRNIHILLRENPEGYQRHELKEEGHREVLSDRCLWPSKSCRAPISHYGTGPR